ncbi:hypothetical protein Q1695_015450 [Nippostrongylus brasiliensis]|nr:hypothetical protein Q1695_015450 [Nippostrongylus brasiliensis]
MIFEGKAPISMYLWRTRNPGSTPGWCKCFASQTISDIHDLRRKSTDIDVSLENQKCVHSRWKNEAVEPASATITSGHQWCSGIIVPSHGTDPGSTPGWCKCFASQTISDIHDLRRKSTDIDVSLENQKCVHSRWKNEAVEPASATITSGHQWCSGIIVPSHGTDPGSTPGWCKCFASQTISDIHDLRRKSTDINVSLENQKSVYSRWKNEAVEPASATITSGHQWCSGIIVPSHGTDPGSTPGWCKCFASQTISDIHDLRRKSTDIDVSLENQKCVHSRWKNEAVEPASATITSGHQWCSGIIVPSHGTDPGSTPGWCKCFASQTISDIHDLRRKSTDIDVSLENQKCVHSRWKNEAVEPASATITSGHQWCSGIIVPSHGTDPGSTPGWCKCFASQTISDIHDLRRKSTDIDVSLENQKCVHSRWKNEAVEPASASATITSGHQWCSGIIVPSHGTDPGSTPGWCKCFASQTISDIHDLRRKSTDIDVSLENQKCVHSRWKNEAVEPASATITSGHQWCSGIIVPSHGTDPGSTPGWCKCFASQTISDIHDLRRKSTDIDVSLENQKCVHSRWKNEAVEPASATITSGHQWCSGIIVPSHGTDPGSTPGWCKCFASQTISDIHDLRRKSTDIDVSLENQKCVHSRWKNEAVEPASATITSGHQWCSGIIVPSHGTDPGSTPGWCKCFASQTISDIHDLRRKSTDIDVSLENQKCVHSRWKNEAVEPASATITSGHQWCSGIIVPSHGTDPGSTPGWCKCFASQTISDIHDLRRKSTDIDVSLENQKCVHSRWKNEAVEPASATITSGHQWCSGIIVPSHGTDPGSTPGWCKCFASQTISDIHDLRRKSTDIDVSLENQKCVHSRWKNEAVEPASATITSGHQWCSGIIVPSHGTDPGSTPGWCKCFASQTISDIHDLRRKSTDIDVSLENQKCVHSRWKNEAVEPASATITSGHQWCSGIIVPSHGTDPGSTPGWCKCFASQTISDIHDLRRKSTDIDVSLENQKCVHSRWKNEAVEPASATITSGHQWCSGIIVPSHGTDPGSTPGWCKCFASQTISDIHDLRRKSTDIDVSLENQKCVHSRWKNEAVEPASATITSGHQWCSGIIVPSHGTDPGSTPGWCKCFASQTISDIHDLRRKSTDIDVSLENQKCVHSRWKNEAVEPASATITSGHQWCSGIIVPSHGTDPGSTPGWCKCFASQTISDIHDLRRKSTDIDVSLENQKCVHSRWKNEAVEPASATITSGHQWCSGIIVPSHGTDPGSTPGWCKCFASQTISDIHDLRRKSTDIDVSLENQKCVHSRWKNEAVEPASATITSGHQWCSGIIVPSHGTDPGSTPGWCKCFASQTISDIHDLRRKSTDIDVSLENQKCVHSRWKNEAVEPASATITSGHQWCSGIIVPSHGTDPGSTPGWCKCFASQTISDIHDLRRKSTDIDVSLENQKCVHSRWKNEAVEPASATITSGHQWCSGIIVPSHGTDPGSTPGWCKCFASQTISDIHDLRRKSTDIDVSLENQKCVHSRWKNEAVEPASATITSGHQWCSGIIVPSHGTDPGSTPGWCKCFASQTISDIHDLRRKSTDIDVSLENQKWCTVDGRMKQSSQLQPR